MTEETMLVENQNDQVTTTAEANNGTTTATADANNTSLSVDAAAAEAAEAAKAAAAAAAEAARVAEQLAAEAAKVAEAAAAEKLRLEEEAAALKLKEFIDAQSDTFRDIYSKVPKVNPQICVKLEELISKSFLTIDDVTNQKLNEALKDLNENCLNAFDEYVSIKEAAAANKTEVSTTEQVPQEQQASQEVPATEGEGQEDSAKPNSTQDTSYSTTQESNVEGGNNDEAETMETTQDANTTAAEMAGSQPASQPQAPNNKQGGAKVKADVDVLSGTLFKWKRSNKDKLTKSGKIQSLLQGQGKNNRRSLERPGPNPEKLKEILARTGYSHEISSGQRKYGGPPPNWNPTNPTPVESESQNTEAEMKEETTEAKPAEETTTTAPTAAAETTEATGEKMEDEMPSSQTELTCSQKEANNATAAACVPPQGCECFVGKLPRDLFEDELIPVFEKHGRIWDLRLMIDPSSGFSKGYCFVTYCDKNEAQAAAKALNDSEIRPGKEIRVNISVANIKLFIGNIPRSKTKEELKAEFSRLVEGLSEVVIYNQGEANNESDNKVKNRGFCFLEFIDHKSASVAKRKLSSSRFNRVFNRELAVDWADPNDEPDEETMSKVKVLYVKNLSAEVTEEEVQKLFEPYGKLERVRKMKDYAFVHFDQREDAVKAMEEQNTKVFGKLPLEISLARPLTDKKKQAQQKRMENNNRGNQQGNGNWNNNGGHYNNHRQNNNNNFNQNGGNRNGNRGGQMNNFNGKNNNGNRGNFNGNGMNNGHMNNNGMGRGNYNNNRGFHNSNNHFNDHNNYNNYNNNNNMRNGGMNNGRGGGGGGNSFRNGNGQRGGNRGGFNNGNQMLHKRKNNDNQFMNGDNNQKKGRFANQSNMNNNGNMGNNDFGNQQMANANNFMGNNGGWSNNNFNGMQQGNDASNEFYQDNFNSNQWL